MAEYIEREAVHDLVQSLTKYAWASPDNTGHRVTVDADDVNFGVDKIPSADVAPVRHGQWIAKGYVCGETEYQCPECKETEWRTSASRLKYCPFCGAKMDGADHEP